MFNDSKKDSPDVDLFAEKSRKEEKVAAKSGEQTESFNVKPRPTAAIKSSIFNDDDDDADMDDFMSPNNVVIASELISTRYALLWGGLSSQFLVSG